jgi:hypothetical protein
MKKQNKIIVLAAVIIFFALIAGLKFPYKIKTPFYIVSQKEWTLVRIDAEKIRSRLIDNSGGKVLSFSLMQYDREDFVLFNLNQKLVNHQKINKSDSIAVFSSSKNQMMLANFKGELQKANANLEMVRSGEKEALQEEAFQSLKMAEVELSAIEPQYLRKKDLQEKNLISVEEWEIIKGAYNIAKSNVMIANARLNAIRSGEKNEIINYMQAQIDLIHDQISLMKKKLNQEIIRSPINGILSFFDNDSIICKVDLEDSVLIRMAVPAGEIKYIKPGQKMDIYISDTGKSYNAFVLNIHQRSIIVNSIPMYIINGQFEENHENIFPGMTGFAGIKATGMSVYERLGMEIRRFNSISFF